MITDIFSPQFNIVNVTREQRIDCANQVMDAFENNIITHPEALDIICEQWFTQWKIAKLLKR